MAASRKIVNKNVSISQARLSSETVADLQRLHLVSRFFNTRQQHGNQRAQAWKFFGFLFCDTSNQARQTVFVAAVSIFNLVYCIQNL